MNEYDMDTIKAFLLEMYDNNENRLAYSLAHPAEWKQIQLLANNIAAHNSVMKEHPIDSMIQVLRDSDIIYDAPIEDEALPRFIINSLIITIIQLSLLEENGCSWDEGIQYCYDNGFFTRLASFGRHAASDDYMDTIDTFKSLNLWWE